MELLKPSASLALLLAAALLVLNAEAAVQSRCSPLSGAKYTTRYDNFDIDSILKNERLLKNYMDCLMDRGPCTTEGCLLREAVPDALQSECSKCSDVQKKQAGRVLAWLLQYKRNYWDELLLKYDPEGNFRKKYGYEEDDDEER